ncbi:hypothetical protein [Galbibacter sp. PAP.153]
MYQVVGDIPNDETIQAIQDAENTKNLSSTDNLKVYKERLLKEDV